MIFISVKAWKKKQRQFAVDVQEWVYSCHLNLEPKKFLQLFEFSSQAQVTANESEELPQSFFQIRGQCAIWALVPSGLNTDACHRIGAATCSTKSGMVRLPSP